MYSGVVFFDFDGTLVDEKEKIFYPTQKTIETINMLQQKGFLVFLATGRAKCYVPEMGIKFDGYVTSNGAYAEIGGKKVLNKLMDKLILNELIEELEKNEICYALENQEICYTNGLENEYFNETLNVFNINKEFFLPVSEAENIECNKLFITYETEDKEEKIKKHFDGRLILGRHRSHMSADIDTVGMTKAVGVKAVIEALGMDLDKTYAFGDGVNDYHMLQTVGHGIAMGAHSPILDEVCEFVTKTVKDDGINFAMKKFGII